MNIGAHPLDEYRAKADGITAKLARAARDHAEAAIVDRILRELVATVTTPFHVPIALYRVHGGPTYRIVIGDARHYTAADVDICTAQPGQVTALFYKAARAAWEAYEPTVEDNITRGTE